MNAADIVGYALDGAEYHIECVSIKQANVACASNGCTSRDENGFCDQNCRGDGPNPIFGDDEPGDCDECTLPIVEYLGDEDDSHDCDSCGTYPCICE